MTHLACVCVADGRQRCRCAVLAHLNPHVPHVPGFLITFVLKVPPRGVWHSAWLQILSVHALPVLRFDLRALHTLLQQLLEPGPGRGAPGTAGTASCSAVSPLRKLCDTLMWVCWCVPGPEPVCVQRDAGHARRQLRVARHGAAPPHGLQPAAVPKGAQLPVDVSAKRHCAGRMAV